MDSFTHLVAGALTPLVFKNTPRRAALICFGIAAGELPDIDIIFGSSPLALMTLHRGITHALFWQPVMALLVSLPFFIWLCNIKAAPAQIPIRPAPALPSSGPAWSKGMTGPSGPAWSKGMTGPSGPAWSKGVTGLDNRGDPTFVRLWFMALIALCVHIYLDCMTTFGTQVLLPFSTARVALPAMFIVDPLLTLPALALLLAALGRPPRFLYMAGAGPGRVLALHADRARLLAGAGLAWIVIYPLLALGLNAAATAQAGGVLARPGDPGARLLLMTEPFSPFVWKKIESVNQGWTLSLAALSAPQAESAASFHQKPDPLLYAALARQEPIFAHFADFAPLMTQTERAAAFQSAGDRAGAVREYAFADLRYLAAPGSITRRVGRGDAMFVLEARVNASGTLLAWRFLQRADDAARTPWVPLQ